MAEHRTKNPSRTNTLSPLQQEAADVMLAAGKVPEAPVLRALSDHALQEIIDYYGSPNAYI